MCWFFSWNNMSILVDMSSCENWTRGNLGFIVSSWTLQSKALPRPYCISDDRIDLELYNYQNMNSLKSKKISWLKLLKYLASGVLVNNFMISRFGTYGPLFSFLKTIKMSICQDECLVFLKKDHLGLVESSKNILSNNFFKNYDQMVFRKVHLGLESFSNILLELTVRRRWMSAVSEH